MGLTKKNKKSVTKKKVTKKRKPAKKAKTPDKNIYETKIDEILNLINKEEKITFQDLATKTNLTNEQIENWLKILQKNNLILTHYPVIGKPFATKFDSKKIPEIENNPDKNKSRNLLIFATICFILFITAYYIFFIR